MKQIYRLYCKSVASKPEKLVTEKYYYNILHINKLSQPRISKTKKKKIIASLQLLF